MVMTMRPTSVRPSNGVLCPLLANAAASTVHEYEVPIVARGDKALVQAQDACRIPTHELSKPCERDVSWADQRRGADAEGGLQTHHAGSAGSFIIRRVGCVVGGDGIDPPLFHGTNQEVHILLCS